MDKIKGFIHLNIGNGKGKTTAAAGMAVRAAGWNKKVLFCQFLKSAKTGELPVLESIGGLITVFRPEMRHKAFLWDQSQSDLIETREDLQKGWKLIKEMMTAGSFDLIVLDEMLDVLKFGFIEESDLLKTTCVQSSDIVLTGREASEKLIEAADYVTNMTFVKHPFAKGISSRKGIEY